ncbi:hypothetical protein C8R47DRAFT_551994 [Mycena vitilis]|nr:hypothetical protein C8R47DRAFT_551994 [Mycena vitilis]
MASSNEDRSRLYAILNISTSATDAEIHERHRTLSLIFHPDKHRDEDSKFVATGKFLEIQKAYEVLSDPFLRAVYDSLGEPGLAVNWLEETRTKSSEELQTVFRRIQHDWLQAKVDSTISPMATVVCKVDASALFIPYQGVQDDGWSRRLQNRLEDVRVPSFSLRHDMQKRITERSMASFTARISRRGASGRGNFMGTLRHQYSPRLAFETEHQSSDNYVFVQTTISPLQLEFPPVFLSVDRRLARRPDSAQGRLRIDLGRHPEVSVSIASQDPLGQFDRVPVLPVAPTFFSWSHGIVLNSYDPKLVGAWTLALGELSLRCKLGLEFGLDGLAWVFLGSWVTEDVGAEAAVNLSHTGVVLTLNATYLQQRLSIPILLSEQHSSLIALWAAAIPSAICLSVYLVRARDRRCRRLRYVTLQISVDVLSWTSAIRSALRALEPDSPSRKDAEAVLSLLKGKARDSSRDEVAKDGLVIVEATYGAMETADRELGLSWDVTVPLQTLVRGSQIYISGRHPKSSIQGFLDPAPYIAKSLRVRYLFRGRMHFAEVPEYLSLILPLADHAVN